MEIKKRLLKCIIFLTVFNIDCLGQEPIKKKCYGRLIGVLMENSLLLVET